MSLRVYPVARPLAFAVSCCVLACGLLAADLGSCCSGLGEQFIDMGVDAAYPLWAISSVRSGGVDYSVSDVGQVWKEVVWDD